MNQSSPYYVLVDRSATAPEALILALDRASRLGLVDEVVLAQSETQRKALWSLRESVGETFRHGPDFAFDVSLPLAELESYCGTLWQEVRRRWPTGHCWIFGHLGDGNLHVSLAVGMGDDDTRAQLESLVYEPLRKIGGAVSAEHGIGLDKKPWLDVSRSKEELKLMRQLKALLDPYGLLNRGKVFDPISTQERD
jgi:FAD/FMN-containing dehydrogenase